MESNSILAISSIVVSILGSLYTILNHKKIRSRCCGSQEIVVASLDIENTTPETKNKTSLQPLPKSDDEETNK